MSASKRELKEQLQVARDQADRIQRIRLAEQSNRLAKFEKALAELHPGPDASVTIITPSGALLKAMVTEIILNQDMLDAGDRLIGGPRSCEIRLAPQPYER